MSGAQTAIAQLVAEGVEVVLSIPGEHNNYLCDAVLDYPQLRFITGRHEQDIAFMADGYARASGQIAVPLVITGPGVCNSLASLADAYQDSVPMVLIAAQAERRFLGKGAFHELKNQTQLLASVTKWNARVESVEEIPEAIRTAFTQARGGRPGPTAVEIPLDIQAQEGRGEIYPSPQLPRQQADPHAVREAARRLSVAISPLVLVGSGAARSDCAAEVIRLLEQLNAACFATYLGKGVVPDAHPLNLGCGWVERGPARRFLEEADLVLVVGSSLGEPETLKWTLPFPKNLIQIDTCAEVLGRNYPGTLGLAGDAKAVLSQLLEELAGRPPGRGASPAARIAEVKRQVYAKLQTKPAWHFIQAMQRALPRDAIVTNDAATANGWVLYFLDRCLPRTCSITYGLAALGYALPAAMGAKLAYPDRQAVAVVGDGGFLFTDSALATAVQYNLNSVAIVFNDGGYRSIERCQLRRFGRTIGIDLHNPDFVKLAEAYGASGERVEQPDQLYGALVAAWQRSVPTVIEIPLSVGDDCF